MAGSGDDGAGQCAGTGPCLLVPMTHCSVVVLCGHVDTHIAHLNPSLKQSQQPQQEAQEAEEAQEEQEEQDDKDEHDEQDD